MNRLHLLVALGLLSACTASAPVDDEVPRWQTLDMAERLADQGMALWPAESQVFNWLNAVWGYGLLAVQEARPDEARSAYEVSWMTQAVERFGGEDPLTFGASDEMAAAGVASLLAAQHPDLDLAPIFAEADAYLDTRASRLTNGAIAHWGEGSVFPSDQVWVDSLFMIGMYWLAEYDRTGDAARLDDVAQQYRLFSDLCRDDGTDLYRHAYDEGAGQNIPTEAVFWARGNAWVLVAASELLERVGSDDPIWSSIQPAFQSHATAVAAAQADDGLWYTVLNDPFPGDGQNYTETSASGLVIASLARGVDAGALDADTFNPVIDRGVRGLLGRIHDDGTDLIVQGTSLGTNPGDYLNYVGTPVFDQFILGMGTTLRALVEVDGRERSPE